MSSGQADETDAVGAFVEGGVGGAAKEAEAGLSGEVRFKVEPVEAVEVHGLRFALLLHPDCSVLADLDDGLIDRDHM